MTEYINKKDILQRIESAAMWNRSVSTLYEDIEGIEPADVSPVRHGRWMCVDTDTEQFFLCNRCKKKEYWESDYCPACGAKMDGGGDHA